MDIQKSVLEDLRARFPEVIFHVRGIPSGGFSVSNDGPPVLNAEIQGFMAGFMAAVRRMADGRL